MAAGLPSKAGIATMVKVEFTPEELQSLQRWVDRLPEPKPDLEQAVRMMVRDGLASARRD